MRLLSAKSTNDNPPETRTRFKEFLAKNPNYFGNFPDAKLDPVEEISADTTFEALTCIGYNQIIGYLQGTIAIKQPVGYLGDLCTQGSDEWVRFYIDYGDENGWQDLGLAGVNVHDIPNADDCYKDSEKPLYYCVTLAFTPDIDEQKFCNSPVLPIIRGIESWNVPPPPNSPNWVPVFGNVLDQNIQIRPRPLLLLDLIDLIPKDVVAKLPSQVTNSPNTPISLPAPAAVDLGTLASKYGKEVAASRFGFPDLHAAITSSGSQQELLAYHNTWSNLKLDFSSALEELQNMSGITQYEQLYCLGLEYSLDWLVATFHIKLPYGYSGTLCTAGSTEYVTFWSDWDNTCQWTFLGTVQVNVHDFLNIPADGLAYDAVLPVDLQSVIRACEQPKIARVRAVLSWGVASSTTDPDALPVFGNILDAHVQLRPGTPTTGPSIRIIGGISTAQIGGNGLTIKNASFALGGAPADPYSGRCCPFGGNIRFQGVTPPNIAQYRIWAQPDITNPPPPFFLTASISAFNENGESKTYNPASGTGWLPYLPQSENWFGELGNFPSPDSQPWRFQLETDTGLTTGWYVIQMDNTAPLVNVTTTVPGFCGDLPVGGTLEGTFTATDTYFSHWQLSILPPQNVPVTDVIVPASSGTGEVPPNPGTWSMSTKGMLACGYVVTVQAWDLAILNSGPGPGNSASMDKGFCLTPATSSSNYKSGWEVVEEEEE